MQTLVIKPILGQTIWLLSIYVRNYRSSVFENSVDDKLAVSYLVDNEN